MHCKFREFKWLQKSTMNTRRTKSHWGGECMVRMREQKGFFFFLFNSGVDGVTEQKKVNVATSTEELFGNNPHRGYCILHTCGYIPLECETR